MPYICQKFKRTLNVSNKLETRKRPLANPEDFHTEYKILRLDLEGIIKELKNGVAARREVVDEWIKPHLDIMTKSFKEQPSEAILDLAFQGISDKFSNDEKMAFLKDILIIVEEKTTQDPNWGKIAGLTKVVTNLTDKILSVLDLEELPAKHELVNLYSSLSSQYPMEMISLLVNKCQGPDIEWMLKDKLSDQIWKAKVMNFEKIEQVKPLLELLSSEQVASKAPGIAEQMPNLLITVFKRKNLTLAASQMVLKCAPKTNLNLRSFFEKMLNVICQYQLRSKFPSVMFLSDLIQFVQEHPNDHLEECLKVFAQNVKAITQKVMTNMHTTLTKVSWIRSKETIDHITCGCDGCTGLKLFMERNEQKTYLQFNAHVRKCIKKTLQLKITNPDKASNPQDQQKWLDDVLKVRYQEIEHKDLRLVDRKTYPHPLRPGCGAIEVIKKPITNQYARQVYNKWVHYTLY